MVGAILDVRRARIFTGENSLGNVHSNIFKNTPLAK
jgi:hypothetical protein